MKVKNCIFCYPDRDMESRMIEGYGEGENWVVVPRQIATLGHLLVVTKKHYNDISDAELSREVLENVTTTIQKLCRNMMKKPLTTPKGKKVKKVYVLTQCETPHLHFQVIPRYEGDMNGNLFLFERELQETRCQLENESREDTNLKGRRRIHQMERILKDHKSLILSDTWVRDTNEVKKLIEETKTEIEKM